MSKRILSFLLALVMVAGLLPTLNLEAQAASSPTLYLGGVQMYDGDYLLVGATATTTTKPTSTATGYAYYKDGTLQLYNYSYEGSGINFKYNNLTFPVALYCDDDLTIELKGGVNRLVQNKDAQRATAIYVCGDITIIGDHDLDIVSTYSGIYALLGNIIVDLGSGEITIESARYGIQSHKGQLSVNGGELIVKTTDNSVDADAYAIYADEGVAIGNRMLIKASTNENAAFSELGVFDPDDVKKYDFIRVRYASPQKVYANATGLTYDSTKGGYAPNFETFNVTLQNANTVTDLSDRYSILYETKSGSTYSNPLTGDPKLEQTYYGYVDIRSYSWSYDVVPENCKIQIPGFDVTVTGCTEREMSTYLRIDYTATYRVEPVYVGGVMMNDGNYLAVGASAVTTAKPSGGYAYYKNNVLTLHDYEYVGRGHIFSAEHYAAVYSGNDLYMVLEGTNSFTLGLGYTYGIITDGSLTITAASGASLALNVGNGPISSDGDMTMSGGTYIQVKDCSGSMFNSGGTLSLTGCTVVDNVKTGSVFQSDRGCMTFTNCNITVEGANQCIVSKSNSSEDIIISGGFVQSTTKGSFVTGQYAGVALTVSNADIDASVTSDSYKLFAPDSYNKGGLKSLTVNGKTAIASKDMGVTWEVYNAGNLNAYQKLTISSDPFDINVTGIGMMEGQYLANGASAATTTKPSTGGYAHYKDGVLTLNNFVYSGSYNDDLIESYNAINLVLVGKNTLATTGADADGISSYDGSVNISGAGSLNISATEDAIFADGNVTVTDAAVTINGGDYGIYAYGNITLDNATVTVKDVEYDGIFAEYSAEIKDSTVNIACGDEGIYAYDDLTVTGSTVTVKTDDGGLGADNVTITGSTVTATSGYVGIGGSDEVCITGSTVAASADYAGIYGESRISITDSDVIAKSTVTEDDETYWAIYVDYGSVNIDSDLKVQASTDPNGTLGVYDPEKHNTYDYIKISRVLGFSTQPTSVNLKTGSTATFKVAAIGTGLTYQWQYKDPAVGVWYNSGMTGNQTATLQVGAIVARHNFQYRCKVTDGNGNVAYSNAATLTVLGIKTQPTGTTANLNEKVDFKVVATGTGLTYQWQYKDPSVGTWYNSGMTGNKTPVMTVEAIAFRNGFQYRCKITDGNGNVVYSNAATLTVLGIKTQPASATAKLNENVNFKVVATGTGLTYQWQYKDPSVGTWYNSGMTGNKTAVMTVEAIAFRNNFQYRCKITDSKGNVIYSNAATLTVKSGPSITTHPTSTYLKTGNTANFKVVATGTNLTYQWQYKDPSVGTWYSSTLTGNKTSTIQVGATVGRNNFQYRCKITDGNGNVAYSNAATLTVFGIKTQPVSATAKLNENVNFKVSAVGNGLTYQWQYKDPSVGTWYNSGMTGNKTAVMTVEAIAFRNNFQYRCKITDSKGNVIYSNAATLTVKSGPSITTQPTSTYLKTGSTANFKVVATGTGLTYQWQYKDPAVGTWYSSTLTGNKTATIQVGATVGRNNFQYRCKITDSNGNVAYSNAATLTVFGIKTQPASATANLNENVNFKVSAVGNGLTYQWQYKDPSVGTWYNSGMTGNKTAVMTVEAIAFRNNFQYRCKITDSKGNVIYTNAVTLTVK